jgi:outer membrane protein OmpA-like peptidoglycan-associated protein
MKNFGSRIAITVLAAAGLMASVGCATKNNVRAQMTPVVNKVNELDDITKKNTNDIKDVDSRTQAGLNDVNAKSTAADQKAQAAGQRASEAQTVASSAANRAESLANTVINLDNYKPMSEAAVHFGFDKAELTKRAKAALDEFGAQIPNAKGYIVELIGGTDSVGNKDYNYELSQRRAAAVVQYLAQKYDVPAHKIYVVGLGKDKAVADNRTTDGRAQNRRVDLRLMTNVQNGPEAVGTSAQNVPQQQK